MSSLKNCTRCVHYIQRGKSCSSYRQFFCSSSLTASCLSSSAISVFLSCALDFTIRLKFISTCNFQDLLVALKGLFKHFQRPYQGPWIFIIEFEHFQGILKHAMNPNLYTMLLHISHLLFPTDCKTTSICLLVRERSALATLRVTRRRVCLWFCGSVVLSAFSKCFFSGSSCRNKLIF